MSDHLIPITPEQLARLPDGVLVETRHPDPGHMSRTYRTRFGMLERALYHPVRVHELPPIWRLHLDLRDTVTAAVVASRIVRPWLLVAIPLGFSGMSLTYSQVERLLDLAIWHEPLTPDQIATLARLARAALEAPCS